MFLVACRQCEVRPAVPPALQMYDVVRHMEALGNTQVVGHQHSVTWLLRPQVTGLLGRKMETHNEVYLNNLLSIPLVCCLMIGFGEHRAIQVCSQGSSHGLLHSHVRRLCLHAVRAHSSRSSSSSRLSGPAITQGVP